MFTAEEARQAVETYYKNTPRKARKTLENIIRNRARYGYSYYTWDYEEEDLTKRQKEEVLKVFKDAGYTVSDAAFIKSATIRW